MVFLNLGLGGKVRDGGNRGSLWWREIVCIREGDPWVDGIPLWEQFGCLFELADTKSRSVAEMFSLGWGIDGEAWQWKRQLRAWDEEMLWECQTLLSNLSLQVQSLHRWQRQPDPVIGYTVQGAYQLLTAQDSATMADAENLIWHPQVPLKVSIFAWRLHRDRLPKKANLVVRDVLSTAADSCVFGCGAAESAHHIFLSCSISGSIWPLVRSWIDITSVDSTSLHDHFVQFTYSSGGSRVRRSFLQLI
ncbi:hypothetical protein TSUD_229270 [Trifolium subterraneum]|uniref:Reverse transcriptase zinc-binding domain-containing protein n=1 Tax=Trifolium subterraneum TaxID=3900 RepID=A0A2Z6ML59_TRISU|nr:hypothetical protein TSUD_229270 [Trifolium subterraneum]